MRAAIYARISLDREGEGQGVERQLEDCRKLVAERGWTLVEEYVDNDVSAFSGKRRPEFERMLTGDFDTLVVWRTDRLARRGKDLQRFLDTGMLLASCTEPEFTGSTGLLMLRILAGFAEHESGVKSERVARKMKQKAENGDPHAGGKRTYGYTADGRQLVPEEADVLREVIRRCLAGERPNHVISDLHGRGLAPTWTGSNLIRYLRSPRLAGYREVGGKLVEGNFPGVIDLATWQALQAVLKPRGRNAVAKQYLLTGLLVCGRCGAKLTGSGGVYRCPPKIRGGCGGIAVVAYRTDAYVTTVALAEIPDEAEDGTGNEVGPLLDAIRQIEVDIEQLAKDHYVSHKISRPAYLAANDELEHRVALLRQQVADEQTGQGLGSVEDIRQAWDHQSVSWRQAVLRVVLDAVEVLPAGGTHEPVPDRLRLRWRACN